MAKVAIVYHSGYGHTEKQAEAVAEGARDAGAEVEVLKADDLTSPDSGPWEALDSADAIIFGSPTYMGSVSGTFEQFADASSKKWQSAAWKDKLAAGFTNSGSFSGDKVLTLLRMVVLAAQQQMIWISLGQPGAEQIHPGDDPENLNRMGYYLGAAAQSDVDKGPDVVPRASDLASARALGRRVVEIAGKFNR
ncbi:flavodoxin family protein [Pontivivens ytuae]|uniref:Flavodoxin family protein n=1 Tax=Pontivivens ytuae TaxID=2789856 RepID=A0A7S9QBG0_9RHOB|nr:flavodoxin family protein [Pontivivens ytuae]QPH52670.1 flavodoxin family protein [Pontivivens ytuae]